MNLLFVGLGLLAAVVAVLYTKDKDSRMATLQQQFDEFHTRIKLDQDDERAKLRDKRDTLIRALANNLDDDVPAFEKFDQGSYAMHTGVLPPDKNYDIDVGIVFDCTRDKYADPVELKKKVCKALNTHGRSVVIRRPCVTVNYMRGNEVDYHVDLAIYVKRDDGLLDLAKGKLNSSTEKRVWEPSDPRKLTDIICTAFSDADDLAQYRRCIRYFKRWRNVQFANGGAPLSIALTVAAKNLFATRFSTSSRPVDLLAMIDWVDALLGQFQQLYTDEGWHRRLVVTLPVTPYCDLMEWMSKGQMETFETKLKSLRQALVDAEAEELPEEACKKLRKQFGDDFPVPEKAATAKAVSAAVISTGHSA